MPVDLVQRINLDLIYEPFLEDVLGLLAACRARGVDYWVTEGFRSYARSHKLRALFLEGKGGKAAPAGQSAHNFGLAVDLARDLDVKRKGLQPSWKKEDFTVLGEEIVKFPRLSWGKSFGDMPHVGLAGFVTGAEIKPLADKWKLSNERDDLTKLREVWEYVDSKVGKK